MPKEKHLHGNNDEEEFDEEDEFGLENENSCDEDEMVEFDEENGEINEENTETFAEEDEPDFMDNFGQLWEFVCRIKEYQDLGEFMAKMEKGMMLKKEDNKKWNKFGCAENGAACPFETIFLKSCSNLYSRGVHNHNQKIETKKEISHHPLRCQDQKQQLGIGDNYIDQFERVWQFHCHIDQNANKNLFRTEFELSAITKHKYGFSMRCQKTVPSAAGGGKCPFHAIFLRSCSNLYTRGVHNHAVQNEKNVPNNIMLERLAENIHQNQNEITCENMSNSLKSKKKKSLEIGENYVDQRGKVWKFYDKIGKNANKQMLCSEFGFSCICTTKQGFQMYCDKSGPDKTCKFGGIYLRDNGCLYINGKHVHKNKVDKKDENKPLKKKTNVFGKNHYVDNFGTFWPLVAKIGKNISKEEFQLKFGIRVNRQTTYGFCLICNKKRKDEIGKCRFRAIYEKTNGYLYAKSTKHDHPGAYEFTKIQE